MFESIEGYLRKPFTGAVHAEHLLLAMMAAVSAYAVLVGAQSFLGAAFYLLSGIMLALSMRKPIGVQTKAEIAVALLALAVAFHMVA